MHIQVQTDEHIHGGESLKQWAREEALKRMDRFRDHITRLEVHLSDVDAGKSHSDNRDKRCKIEARPAGRQPMIVIADGLRVEDAFVGAIDKMIRVLETDMGRQRDKNGRETIRDVVHSPNPPISEPRPSPMP